MFGEGGGGDNAGLGEVIDVLEGLEANVGYRLRYCDGVEDGILRR